jgi:DNA repair exonuclease SbcCD ATPase subunit
MTNEERKPPERAESRPGFALRVLRVLLRLLVVLLLGVGLGVLIFYGVPRVYGEFIEPVRSNSERLTELEASLRVELERQRAQLSQLEAQFAEAEGDLAAQREALAELQAQREGLAQTLQQLEGALEPLDPLPGRVRQLQRDNEDLGDRLRSVEELLAEGGEPVQRLDRQLHLIRAMELLTHARLWLTEDNLGKASDDLSAAKAIIEGVIASAPETEKERLRSVADRLEAALLDLRLVPAVAEDDLEIVWELLLAVTAAEPPQPEP